MSDPRIAAPVSTGARRSAAAVRAYAEVSLMVSASTLAGLLMAPRWGAGPVDLLYLPPVLAAASLFGFRPALYAALVSALAYNFFFTAPIHSFRIDRPADLVTVFILFLVALVTSQLAARMREQARIAAANAARNATIAGLARRLLSCSNLREIGEVACAEIGLVFGCNALLAVPGTVQPETVARSPGAGAPTPSDIAACALALASGEAAGRGAARFDPAQWLFHPIRSETGVVAALGLARDDGLPAVVEESLALLGSLLDQLALALERVRLEAQAREMDSLRERDQLRRALLSSVSHDLRTPLTAIIAASAELDAGGNQAELVDTLRAEAGKLDRYIANLLDMARIEAGNVRVKEEAVDLVDAVDAAVADLRRSLNGRQVEISLPPDLPLVRADPNLLHHVLINLIDNGARHGGSGPMRIAAERVDEGAVRLSIADEGPGLRDEEARLFETFARIDGSDRKGGAGLGLAIVKGFAGAMGVEVEASNRASGPGAEFSLIFPRQRVVDEDEIGQESENIDR